MILELYINEYLYIIFNKNVRNKIFNIKYLVKIN